MESNVTPIKFRNTSTRRHRDNTATSKQGMDFLLFFTVCAISLFGVVMLFSASYYKALSETGNVMGIVRNQVIYLAAGIAAMFIISHVNYSILRTKGLIIAGYVITILLLGTTLIVGRTVLGARRWLDIGPVSMQPSELVKFVLSVCMAYYISTYPKKIATVKGFLFLIAMAIPPLALIYLQPNMSMLIIIVALTGVMLFLGGAPWKYLGSVAGVGVVGLGILTLVAGYRTNRITSWIDPWKDPSGKAYQVIQSMYAFANGGFIGQGFNNSRQKLLFLPEMENDYVLSIIAEELGFVGVTILLAAYAFVIYRGIRIALSVKDRFGSLAAFGITCAIAFQVIVNVGVVTNALPSTGQSLPFISAGGSSLLVFMAAVGVLLNISRHTKTSKTPLFKNTEDQ